MDQRGVLPLESLDLLAVNRAPTTVMPNLPNQPGLLGSADMACGMWQVRRSDEFSEVLEVKRPIGAANQLADFALDFSLTDRLLGNRDRLVA